MILLILPVQTLLRLQDIVKNMWTCGHKFHQHGVLTFYAGHANGHFKFILFKLLYLNSHY